MTTITFREPAGGQFVFLGGSQHLGNGMRQMTVEDDQAAATLAELTRKGCWGFVLDVPAVDVFEERKQALLARKKRRS